LALKRAIWRRRPGPDCIFHSDRGVQFACDGFRKVLKEYGFIQSMSRKGDCWDNAVAESFFNLFKADLTRDSNFIGREDASKSIFEYLEIYFNHRRRHSAIGYATPAEFEKINQFA